MSDDAVSKYIYLIIQVKLEVLHDQRQQIERVRIYKNIGRYYK
jgi:hypothetical protein